MLGPVSIEVIRSTEDPRYAHCSKIRRMVFQFGQNVPEAREVDGLDSSSIHFLATVGEEAVGVARMRIHEGWAKAERVAVMGAVRGAGVGRALMAALEFEAVEQGCAGVLLSSQLEAVGFYERLHYISFGEPYYDADILHRDMRKSLAQPDEDQSAGTQGL